MQPTSVSLARLQLHAPQRGAWAHAQLIGSQPLGRALHSSAVPRHPGMLLGLQLEAKVPAAQPPAGTSMQDVVATQSSVAAHVVAPQATPPSAPLVLPSEPHAAESTAPASQTTSAIERIILNRL